MVNMNQFKDPAIYGLTGPDGGVFYIGKTTGNALNRWWQHKSRARAGHPAPVYVKMRDVGVDNTGWVIIERFGDIPPGVTPKEREAWWIAKYVTDGISLTNVLGKDGTPDSWPPELKSRSAKNRRGVPTWIKGKTGEDAGWTDERREQQSKRMRLAKWKREIDDPQLLYIRIDKIEQKTIRDIQRKAAMEHKRATTPPRSPRSLPKHGTRTMWEKYKCKCDPCRDAGARRNAKKRGNPNWESVTARNKTPLKEIHGTLASYKNRGCRCDICKSAARDHRTRRKGV